MNTTANLGKYPTKQNFFNVKYELDPDKILFAPNDEGVIVYEVFKDIPNYEGYYQVSNFGRVKSFIKWRGINKRILKNYLNNKGYYSVALLGKTSKTHQLVAIVFLDHKPNGQELVINHKDFIRTNNFEWNLEIITMRENGNQKHLPSSSQYTGVCWEKNNKNWTARVRVKGKLLHLGVFDNEKLASEFYQNALKAIENGTEIQVKNPNFSSDYKGVSLYKSRNKWRSEITTKNGRKYLGIFDTEYEAHLAYQNELNL